MQKVCSIDSNNGDNDEVYILVTPIVEGHRAIKAVTFPFLTHPASTVSYQLKTQKPGLAWSLYQHVHPVQDIHGSQIFQHLSHTVRLTMCQKGYTIINYIDDFAALIDLMNELGLTIS